MTSAALDSYFRKLLDIEDFAGLDPSMNGIQLTMTGRRYGK